MSYKPSDSDGEGLDCASVEDVEDWFTAIQPVLDETTGIREHHGIRFGYYDDETDDHAEAVENMNRVLAERANVSARDRVLDVGCGVGESAVWLAETYGVAVVGINVTEVQLERARSLADERGVADLVEFRREDFHEMATIDDDSFDVAWAIESISHAEDRPEALQQVQRVLRPGGRIAVADFFGTDKERDMDAQRRIRKFQWGCNQQPLIEEGLVQDVLDSLGLSDVSSIDVTENVAPNTELSRDAALAILDEVTVPELVEQQAVLDFVLAALHTPLVIEDGYVAYRHVTGEITEADVAPA